jgi:hypothetical protein
MSLDDVRMRLQPTAALSLDLFQLIEGGEDPIGQWLVGKGPQTLRRLYLWGTGRQEHQVDALRQGEASTPVPASTIQHQHEVFVWPCSDPPFAKAARARKKTSTLTVGKSSQLVCPLCGCTKAKTSIHS